jgi:FKBP-type peptidyl-prolyl cis-trans isomerase (trigger factor)
LNIPEVKTEAELKKHLSSKIESKNKEKFTKNSHEEISKYIIDNSKISYYPQTLVDEEKRRLSEEFNGNIAKNRITFDQAMRYMGFKTQSEFLN